MKAANLVAVTKPFAIEMIAVVILQLVVTARLKWVTSNYT